MFPKSAVGSLGYVFMLIVACGGGGDDGDAGTGVATAAGTSGSGGATGPGGTSITSTSGADGSGPASGSGGTNGSDGANGSGGTNGSDGASGAGGMGGSGGRAGTDDGSAGTGVVDAAVNDAPKEGAGDGATTSQCLGANQACAVDGGTCCEAYVCRLGKCCVPTGTWSSCLTNSDCCSNSCVQRQCTCAPLGFSCTGPGQCCAGFACENGTCICPPDIRGCN